MNKFFYVYLAGGTLAVGMLIYDLVTGYSKVGISGLLYEILPAILLYYLAFKTYHEKNDHELM